MEREHLWVKPELNRYLFALLGRAELIDQWWYSPNKAFDMKTPDQVYQTGKEGRDTVANYILGMCDGSYS